MGRYTTPEAVLASIGASQDDPGLLLAATESVEQAEDWIDGYLGHPFGDTDSQPGQPVTDELANVDGPLVLLNKVPVSGMLEVAIRSRAVGADEEILEEFVTYELSDPAHGILRLGHWWRGAQLRISYITAHDTIPSSVRRAALFIARDFLLSTSPAASAILAETTALGQMEAVTIEGTLRVDYATPRISQSSITATGRIGVSDDVLMLLAPWRRKTRFVFA